MIILIAIACGAPSTDIHDTAAEVEPVVERIAALCVDGELEALVSGAGLDGAEIIGYDDGVEVWRAPLVACGDDWTAALACVYADLVVVDGPACGVAMRWSSSQREAVPPHCPELPWIEGGGRCE